MSIATAITNAQNKVSAAYTALNAKGATMPATQDLANMPTAIASVPDSDKLLIDIKGMDTDTITLPQGLNVKYGLDGLFHTNTGLTSVTVPTYFTRIGVYAFYNASRLKRLNSETDGVFNLWEGITELATYCFSACKALTTINIPSTVTTINANVFYGCTALTSIDLSLASNVTSLSNYFVRGCTSLVSIDMSAMTGVTTWGTYMLANCTSLTNVILPPNLTATNTYCFYSSTSLQKITIPDSVTAINNYAFSGCTSLTEINFGNTRTTVPTLSSTNAFNSGGDALNSRKIIVPDSLYSDWKAATNWKSTTNSIVNQIIAYSDYYSS